MACHASTRIGGSSAFRLLGKGRSRVNQGGLESTATSLSHAAVVPLVGWDEGVGTIEDSREKLVTNRPSVITMAELGRPPVANAVLKVSF